MNKQKSFDCVKMKWDIQSQINKELAGIPKEQAQKIHLKRIAQNPIIGPFLQKVKERKTQEIF